MRHEPPATSIEFNAIQDPETGLALLAKRPPEQEWDRLFWQDQFTLWRNWRAGDAQAVSHAVTCWRFYKRPPPLWLCYASIELYERWCIPDDEKRERGDLTRHFLRWEAVELVRGHRPWDPRNYKREVRGDAVWDEAAKLVADTDAEARAETV